MLSAMAKLIAFLSTAAFICLLIAIIVYLRVYNPDSGRHLLDTGAVVTEVRQLNELTTVKYSIEKVVGLKEEKSPVGEESILLLVRGQVRAGVDLGALRQADVVFVNRDSVRIHLDPAHIEDVYLDEKYTQVWDRHVTWWTPWVTPDINLEHNARLKAIADIKATALQMGILTDAQKNAETDIRKILQAFGLQRVSFVYGS